MDSKLEDEKANILDSITDYLSQDIRGSKILIYGVANISLIIALRRIRPFSRFSKPSDIPDRFLKSKVPLHGTVTRIEPSGGPFIMIETRPLIPLPHFGNKKQLPVKLADVDITGNGISWLQIVTNQKKVTIVPLVKHKDSIECTVTLKEANEKTLDLGQELVKLGFGIVREPHPSLVTDKHALSYHKSLIAAQKRAEKKRNGRWHFAIYPTLLWRLKMAIAQRSKAILPKIITRQLDI